MPGELFVFIALLVGDAKSGKVARWIAITAFAMAHYAECCELETA